MSVLYYTAQDVKEGFGVQTSLTESLYCNKPIGVKMVYSTRGMVFFFSFLLLAALPPVKFHEHKYLPPVINRNNKFSLLIK